MEILAYVALFSAATGALLGWCSNCGYAKLVIRCALASVIFELIWSYGMDDGPEFSSVSHVATALIYLAGPYMVFLFTPNMAFAIITYRFKPKAKAKIV